MNSKRSGKTVELPPTENVKMTISAAEKKYFRELFNLNIMKNPDGTEMQLKRLNREGLYQIFTMIGFEPNEKQNKTTKLTHTNKPIKNKQNLALGTG